MSWKSTKNRSTIDQKSIKKLIKKVIDFMIDFWLIFGRFLGPSWDRNRPKSTKNRYQKLIEILIDFWVGWVHASRRRPGGGWLPIVQQFFIPLGTFMEHWSLHIRALYTWVCKFQGETSYKIPSKNIHTWLCKYQWMYVWIDTYISKCMYGWTHTHTYIRPSLDKSTLELAQLHQPTHVKTNPKLTQS